MRMPRDLLWLACLSAPAIVQAGPPAAATRSGTVVAPVEGRLPNGLRFVVVPRRGSESGAGIVMRVAGGFLAEARPGERGVAHLIEHLAFTSPTTGSPDDLGHFPRLGLPLTYPAPSAATTEWGDSTYFVATRTTAPADIDTLLGLYREVATDLTFRRDAVDAQRTDVMHEMAERRAGNVIYAGYIRAVGPGSPTDLIDGQNSDDVPVANIATIRALYRRIYRPGNVTIVIVGGVDPAPTRQAIERHFGDWQAIGPTPPPLATPRLDANRIAPFSVSTAADARDVAMVTVASPTPPPLAATAAADAMLIEAVVTQVIGDRLTAAFPDRPRGSVGVHFENGELGVRRLILWHNFAPERWDVATPELAHATCDLASATFARDEWAMAKGEVLRDLGARAALSSQSGNIDLAKAIARAVAAGRPIVTPDALLDRAQASLPTLTATAGSDWWHREWRAGRQHLRVESALLAEVDRPLMAVRVAAAVPPGCTIGR